MAPSKRANLIHRKGACASRLKLNGEGGHECVQMTAHTRVHTQSSIGRRARGGHALSLTCGCCVDCRVERVLPPSRACEGGLMGQDEQVSFQSEQKRPTKGTHTPHVVSGGVELSVGMRLRCVTAVVAGVEVRGKRGWQHTDHTESRCAQDSSGTHTHACASPVSKSSDDVGWWRKPCKAHAAKTNHVSARSTMGGGRAVALTLVAWRWASG
jgi:hypothetical protein